MMKHTKILLSEIAKIIGAELRGKDREVCAVVPPEEARSDALCVVWDLKELEKIAPDVPLLTTPSAGRDGLIAEKPRNLLPALLKIFERERPKRVGVHPTAIVGERAQISESAWVGAFCVIGDGVMIGDGVQLEAHVYVDDDCSVGENSVIEANVSVRRAKVGKNALLHSGCVIGCDGFGFLPTPTGVVKIPQIGGVIIGNDVEVGACSTIDCGTIGDTVIGDGTRIDNQVQIGHNCKIGKNCLFCAKSGVAGSTTIGDNVIFAAEAGARDHVTIGSNTQIGGRGGVTHNIPSGVVVSGFPAQDHKKELKLQAYISRLPILAERVKKIEKILEVKN